MSRSLLEKARAAVVLQVELLWVEGTRAELAPLEVPLEELGHQLVSVRHTGKTQEDRG